MKRILITGAGSYIGTSFEKYLKQWPDRYYVDTVDMIDGTWREKDFSGYDTVFHVAGIAHSDSGKISEERSKLYYQVNTDLTIETAQKAKDEGVKQFIFMSSAIVYGESAPIGKPKLITRDTPVSPANCYGDSKVQAENGIRKLEDLFFKVVILRPPMIYGKGSKGNYPVMAKMAQKLPLFPNVENRRSMLYIENLTEFIRLMIENEETGTFFPQNAEYSNTSQLVKEIAKVHGKKVTLVKGFTWALKIMSHCTGIVNKAFGNLAYDQEISQYREDYRKCSLKSSIYQTESASTVQHTSDPCEKLKDLKGKKVLFIALPGYSKGMIQKMEDLGAEVAYIHDKPNEGALCKTLGRLQFKPYIKVIESYYQEELEKYKNTQFDYILVIRGEYTPAATLSTMRKMYPKSKMVLYMWDGLANNKYVISKWHLYDRVYTFDRIDYLEYQTQLRFKPLFYYEDYLPESNGEKKYDLCFIGTGHEDRIRVIKKIAEDCHKAGMTSFLYFFMPHKLIYLKNKLGNKDFKNVAVHDLHFEPLPMKKLYEIYGSAECIIDMENSGQHGLTMRSIEIIGLKKKLITTNADIVNYDFYNPNNIAVIDRKHPVLDIDFMKKAYEPLSDDLYEKYALGNWLLAVLSE
ncbi:MAG: NAD-dependent epimerase/dehydratase family protein [Oscillospiraceae bacterium]|nr:NAD-dependent epimerase/dehydratase family protein [Oscillospiraceae bacterium]